MSSRQTARVRVASQPTLRSPACWCRTSPTPLTTHTGEQLRDRVPPSELIQRHAELAGGLLPWTFGLLIAAGLTTWLWRRSETARTVAPVDPSPGARPAGDLLVGTHRTEAVASRAPGALVRAAVAVVALLAATGTVVQVVRIGDSGARATWHNVPAVARSGPDRGDHG